MNEAQTDISLEVLLANLNRGDVTAAEEVFVRYEPYLRLLVRRRLSAPLRAKFDSIDVVQSVWADLMHGFRENGWRFPDAAHLQAFLVKVTRNRFIDRVRRHKNALAHEQPLATAPADQLPPTAEPAPDEQAQADELWEQLMELCPPGHHELLRLKREGFGLADIAERTGLHPSSVRRILYDLARRLAVHQQAPPEKFAAES
jgi:RNA polymerase sigma factor (sigma-70 family)